MKKDKGKAFGAKKDSKDDAGFECGKKGYFKRDCYKLKDKTNQFKPQAHLKDRKKTKEFLTLSDDEDSYSLDSFEEMVNLVLVGL